MKTLSDCISALSRVKHLLTDPDAGPCVDECAGVIEQVLERLDDLECERKIAAMEEEPISLVLESNDAYERFGIRIATGR